MSDTNYISILFIIFGFVAAYLIAKKRKEKKNPPPIQWQETRRVSVAENQSFCHNCGAELPSGVGYCPGCGAAVNAGRSISVSERRRVCPKCGGTMTIQTVVEQKKVGCLTILLYILLTITIFGILIVIVLVLRKKTETVTYAVCQSCGYRERI